MQRTTFSNYFTAMMAIYVVVEVSKHFPTVINSAHYAYLECLVRKWLTCSFRFSDLFSHNEHENVEDDIAILYSILYNFNTSTAADSACSLVWFLQLSDRFKIMEDLSSMSVEELSIWLQEQGIPSDFCKVIAANIILLTERSLCILQNRKSSPWWHQLAYMPW